MNQTILKVTGLSKSYHGTLAVDGIDLEIQKGDIYGFIGVNGAGKSTFMRMITGLAEPTEGKIELFGESTKTGLRKARRNIGCLVERPAFYPNMTAKENLEVQRCYLAQKDKAIIEETLQLVGLTNTGKKKAGEFSLGMQQRLGLAIALIGKPQFLILDEPNIGLDPVGIVELREFLRGLQKERGLTILFSSHNLVEMKQLATKYAIIHKGKLIKNMTAEEMEEECKDKEQDLESYFINLINQSKNSGVRA